MDFDNQIAEIRKCFSDIEISVESEGGCRFLRLASFFKDPADPSVRLTCLFGCDQHLGYETRLWFPKVFKTSQPSENWNSPNIYILGSTWNAFSYTTAGGTLLQKLLSHLEGAK